MNKKALSIIALGLVGIGSLVIANSFISYLSPRYDDAPSVDVSRMAPGEIKEYQGKTFHIYIRKLGGEEQFDLVAIPHRDGKFLLPEFKWNRPLLPCGDFGLSTSSTYKCLDAGERWWHLMEWDINGRYVGKVNWGEDIPDMIKPKYNYKFGFLYLYDS